MFARSLFHGLRIDQMREILTNSRLAQNAYMPLDALV